MQTLQQTLYRKGQGNHCDKKMFRVMAVFSGIRRLLDLKEQGYSEQQQPYPKQHCSAWSCLSPQTQQQVGEALGEGLRGTSDFSS